MDKEIKEILARLSRYVITPDVRHDFDDLLDYITNLQEIEKDHQRINGELRQQLKQTEELAMEYKTIIDKAIKCFEDFVDEKYIYKILKGSDKE